MRKFAIGVHHYRSVTGSRARKCMPKILRRAPQDGGPLPFGWIMRVAVGPRRRGCNEVRLDSRFDAPDSGSAGRVRSEARWQELSGRTERVYPRTDQPRRARGGGDPGDGVRCGGGRKEPRLEPDLAPKFQRVRRSRRSQRLYHDQRACCAGCGASAGADPGDGDGTLAERGRARGRHRQRIGPASSASRNTASPR